MAATKADVCLVLSKNMKQYIDTKYGVNSVLFANGIDNDNHLIDRVMELPEYEFFCHAQIVTELNRYNADQYSHA